MKMRFVADNDREAFENVKQAMERNRIFPVNNDYDLSNIMAFRIFTRTEVQLMFLTNMLSGKWLYKEANFKYEFTPSCIASLLSDRYVQICNENDCVLYKLMYTELGD